jgi:hypothetical protein
MAAVGCGRPWLIDCFNGYVTFNYGQKTHRIPIENPRVDGSIPPLATRIDSNGINPLAQPPYWASVSMTLEPAALNRMLTRCRSTYRNQWITSEQLEGLAQPLAKNGYGQYLLQILNDKVY